MALSEEEQRLLEQMEAALAAEDPKLVNTLRGTGVRKLHRRRAAIAGVGFFVGLGLLIVGMYLMSSGPIGYVGLSLLGFAIMVAAAVTAIYSGSTWARALRHGAATDPGPPGHSSDGTFMDKMEERWRRRRDESGF